MYRLVLPRLMNLLERRVISEMEMMYDQGEDVCEDALRILEPCQIHNADQLHQCVFDKYLALQWLKINFRSKMGLNRKRS